MKFSEVTVATVKDYAKIDYDDDDILLQAILDGAKSHIRAYTGLDNLALDEREDTSIALMVLANDMYGNRMATDVSNGKINLVLDRILGSYSVNLL
ncbi:phage gp6-like head-tail connector protein [Andreesenia angusta]|uniref:Phage gp6-like head-tail connector protein n=1 Tax=Andreesenia angusta TaxID=39480 RepID=A0A1S1V8J3_9FIRM|nr:head-tail connector protein [Andreesenia angusta]OHW62912.1 phage gp6-like head-tail connector protein [Andreesenia angusta]